MTIPTITTSRLTLRPFTPTDSSDVQRLAGDRSIADTTAQLPHPYLDGMAEAWISQHEAQYKEGTGLAMAIERSSDSMLIGAISLMGIAYGHQAELGYWIGKPFWGLGYCTEAARAITEFAFTQMGLVRLHASRLTRNPASGAVLRKVGMKHEGTRIGHISKWGVLEDQELYGVMKWDWPETSVRNSPATISSSSSRTKCSVHPYASLLASQMFPHEIDRQTQSPGSQEQMVGFFSSFVIKYMKKAGFVFGLLLASTCLAVEAPSIVGAIIKFQTAGTFRPYQVYYMRDDGTMIHLWDNDGSDFPKNSSPPAGAVRAKFVESKDPNDGSVLHLTIDGKKETLFFSSPKGGTSTILTSFEILGRSYLNDAVTNISNRGFVIPGKTCITGFINDGAESRLFLIRAMGRTLEEFDVDATDAATFDVYQGQNKIGSSQVYEAPDWEELHGLAGAFPAKAGTKEAIFFGFLPPGTYTVVARGGVKAGDILGEVYELGFSAK